VKSKGHMSRNTAPRGLATAALSTNTPEGGHSAYVRRCGFAPARREMRDHGGVSVRFPRKPFPLFELDLQAGVSPMKVSVTTD
jgi:hypothetical protein